MYTINLTQQQFEQLQSNKTLTINLDKPKQDKLTPSSGNWNVSLVGEPYYNTLLIQDEKYSEAGLEYETEVEAVKASKELRAYARQLKWLSENSDGFIADWNNTNQYKYYIYYRTKTKEYHFSSNQTDKRLGATYMSKDNAEKLVRLLNKGVVEF